jgi:ribosomal protein S18 acetylase RimI-like enzyme
MVEPASAAAEGANRIEVTRTYLELTDAASLRAAECPAPGYVLVRVGACPASFYRYLYAEVGRGYRWTDRSDWSDETIRAHLARPEISLHVLYGDGAPAGYFELRRCDDGSVEIAYFGLLPEFVGRGLGKYLLTCATREALHATRRVWLHTCTLDHPGALPNYEKRGFRPFREEKYWIQGS